MTQDEAAELVTMLVEAFRPAQWSPVALNVYVVGIVDLPYDAALAAALALVQTATFMPRVSEIRKALIPTRVDGAVAWQEVMTAVQRVGRYGTPQWSDPLIGDLVACLGGWGALCASEHTGVDRAHFLRMWEARTESSQHQAMLSPATRDALAAALAPPNRVEIGP